MEPILVKISQDNSTWYDLQMPSEYSLSMEDLDDSSYRSVVNGNLIRKRITPRWIKIGLNYNYVTDAQLNTIARLINTNSTFYCQCKSPAFGNAGPDDTWVSFRAYCSHYEAAMLPKQLGWRVQFNIIQSHKSEGYQ